MSKYCLFSAAGDQGEFRWDWENLRQEGVEEEKEILKKLLSKMLSSCSAMQMFSQWGWSMQMLSQ